jgi:hypothetical protein
MSIAEQLEYLANTKEQIRQAINVKGGKLTLEDAFRLYAKAIQRLVLSGGEDGTGFVDSVTLLDAWRTYADEAFSIRGSFDARKLESLIPPCAESFVTDDLVTLLSARRTSADEAFSIRGSFDARKLESLIPPFAESFVTDDLVTLLSARRTGAESVFMAGDSCTCEFI